MRSKSAEKPVDAALLPSVDEMLSEAATVELIAEFGRTRVMAMVRALIAAKRSMILDGRAGVDPGNRTTLIAELSGQLTTLARAERAAGVQRVINATGVIIHTNLGRARLSDRAVAAMSDAAGYSSIEYDVSKGSRGIRGPKTAGLVRLLTGSEDALAVNNCAAAALLVLSVFAQGREVIVSRGELVEIGGDFRIPDILTRSGAVLREVGTTNRTHLRDYENAISDRTAMILKVHPSNFRISGFTKTPSTADLAGLAKKHSLVFYEDAGSGALIDLSEAGIKGEPVIRDVIASGADLVSFSGDKLLGGPQAGIIAGRAEIVDRLRRDPFYRAMRLDKTITAALDATLEAYARGSAEQEIPVLAMLSVSWRQLAARSEKFVERLIGALGERAGLKLELSSGLSAVGGGAAPDSALQTTLIALTHPEMTDAQLEQKLRSSDPPIITRIEAGRVLLDLRTVSDREESELVGAIAAFFAEGKTD